MRQKLWREHLLVIDDSTFADPVCDEFFKKKWNAAAARNTKIYEEIFNVVPTDTVHTFAVRSRSSVAMCEWSYDWMSDFSNCENA